MFKSNKYSRWYFDIIENANKQARIKKSNVYYESHHIIPKSIGGNDDISNKVLLTAKEHFICHQLLCRMVAANDHIKKMKYALWCMVNGNGRRIERRIKMSPILYAKIREEFSEIRSINTSGANNHFYGKTHSEASRRLISENNSTKREEVLLKMRKPKSKKRVFVPCSDAKKAAISAKLRGRKRK